jgi:hypothetical protein
MSTPLQKATKPKYKVRDWKKYNASLCKRGSLTLFFSPEILDQWEALSKKKEKLWVNQPIQIVLSSAVY